MKVTNLGEFEELVLLTIGVLNTNAYGISIKAFLKEKTGRNPSIGALHSALSRLEKKGYVKSRIEDATPERRGRRKRFYDLTAAGRKVLVKVHELRSTLLHEIPSIQLS